METNIINGNNQEVMQVEQSAGLANFLSSIPDSLASSTEGGEGEITDEQKEEQEAAKKLAEATTKADEEKKIEDEEKAKLEKAEKEAAAAAAPEGSTVEDSIIKQAKLELGLEDDEEEDDETVEGLINVAKRGIERARAEAKNEGPTELYEKLPVVKQLVEHIEAGGSVISFQRPQQIEDFSKIEIADTDLELQEKFYRASLSAKGIDEEEIEDSVNTAKDRGVLLDRAKKAKDYLVQQQADKIALQIKAEQTALQEQIKADKLVEDEVRAILKTGKVLGVAIAPEEAKSLEKWGLEKDAKGLTARDKAYQALTTEQSLILDKIIFNGFKGLGIKTPTQTSTKSLADLKKKAEKTVDLKTNGATVGSQLGINSVKDLFQNSNQ